MSRGAAAGAGRSVASSGGPELWTAPEVLAGIFRVPFSPSPPPSGSLCLGGSGNEKWGSG